MLSLFWQSRWAWANQLDCPESGELGRLFVFIRVNSWLKPQAPKNRWRVSGDRPGMSTKVRKSIVLNCRSRAGGPQIFPPSVIYARRSLGIFTSSAVNWVSEQSYAGRGRVRQAGGAKCLRHKSVYAE